MLLKRSLLDSIHENEDDSDNRLIKKNRNSFFNLTSENFNRYSNLTNNEFPSRISKEKLTSDFKTVFQSTIYNIKSKIINPFLPEFSPQKKKLCDISRPYSMPSNFDSPLCRLKLNNLFNISHSLMPALPKKDYNEIPPKDSALPIIKPESLCLIPQKILKKSEAIFVNFPNLISQDLGGNIIYSTDDFFGSSANILKSCSNENCHFEYNSLNSSNDCWLTRRRRCPGHDWCIIELGTPGIILGIEIDTKGLVGEYAPYCSIEGAYIPELNREIKHKLERNSYSLYVPGETCVSQDCDIAKLIASLLNEYSTDSSDQWLDILPMTQLNSGIDHEESIHYFAIYPGDKPRVTTHLRLNLFPDGGIRRLKAYGYAVTPLQKDKCYNLGDVLLGAVLIDSSNQSFGSASNLIMPDDLESINNFWMTIRNPARHPFLEYNTNSTGLTNLIGENWAIIRLASRGEISCIEIDTTNIIGSYPEKVAVYATDLVSNIHFGNIFEQYDYFRENKDSIWKILLPPTLLRPNKNHIFKLVSVDKRKGKYRSTPLTKTSKEKDITQKLLLGLGYITHVKVVIYPDGGLSRVRIIGRIEE